MIYAIEGPDKAGKSTLFEALKGRIIATFVPRLPMVAALFPVMREVEIRNEALWRALYDPDRIYVTDRHFSVSDQVYSRLHGRELRDYSFWYDRVCPIYLRVSVEELTRRHTEVGDEFFDPKHYCRTVSLYDAVVDQFPKSIVVHGHLSTGKIVEYVCLRISSLSIGNGG